MEYPLLEQAGWSWSGIADAIRELDVDPHAMLCEINTAYRDAISKQQELERELEKAKSQRSYAVSCFVHVARVIEQEEMCFIADGDAVVVKILDAHEMRIDYEKSALNVLPKSPSS